MKRQKNTPTVQYLVEVVMPGDGFVIDRYTIEQVETGRVDRHGNQPNYNTIQRHLSTNAARTGMEYRIVHWGEVEDRSHWVAGGSLDG